MRPSSLSILALAAVMSSCKSDKPQAAAHATPVVAVQTVTTEAVRVTNELPGRIDALRVSQVRARVPGILLEKNFAEGSDVKAGETLFRIDPAPLQAANASAKATLAKVEANLAQSKTQETRYKELVGINAVSKQNFDNATAAVKALEAEVLAAKAAVETSELNLGYATVTAPIAGRIGRALVTEGALVGQNEATPLAVIQQLDPIYFDFTQSTTDQLKLRRDMEQGKWKKVAPDQAQVELLLDDGSTYELAGKLLFSEVSVDPSTGMVRMRAEFSNPKGMLLPGMFARIRLAQAVDENAITVPQRAVTRIQGGKGSVIVVSADHKTELRTITTGRSVGDKWVVSEGLKPGEIIVIEGLQKIMQPGMQVQTVPYEAKEVVQKKAAESNIKPQ